MSAEEMIQRRDEARTEDRQLLAQLLDIDRELKITRGWKYDDLLREKHQVVIRRSELRAELDDAHRAIFEAKRLARVRNLGEVPVASLLRDAARRVGHLESVYMNAVEFHREPTAENVARFDSAVKRAMRELGDDAND